MRQASYFDAQDWDEVLCGVCPQRCLVPPGRHGACGVRANRRGAMVLETYGRVAWRGVASPEVLPLFHFDPWLRWYLVGMKSCTMRCSFCNTSRYSQAGGVPQELLGPGALVEAAVGAGATGLSFGINEPTTAIEYVVDALAAARAAGLATHVATSGYIEDTPLRDLLDVTDALTVGIKSMDQGVLDVECGGNVPTTVRCARIASQRGCHVELTAIVWPATSWPGTPRTRNRDAAAIGELLDLLPERSPLVLLPFEPAMRWSASPRANADDLASFRDLLGARGPRVYTWHPDGRHVDTRCPKCSRSLVRRAGGLYLPPAERITTCPGCEEPLPFAGLR